MKKLFLNLKSLIINHSKSKILALILLPFVTYGLFYVFANRNSSEIQTYAVDPLIVTYDGGPPPNPMFVVTNMLPGDEVEKIFNVENDSPDSEEVTMNGTKTNELKVFAAILDIIITEEFSATIVFSGKLQAFFDSPPISLGSFPAGTDKDFRVKVMFPLNAGNDYQKAKVIFSIVWQTEAPPIELPAECKDLEGKITSVIEGTESNDRIDGTPANELILAKGGNDRVDGNNGDDCIIGGEGSDKKLDGGEGNDIIVGGNGSDKIGGGSGDDIIYGNDGNDHIDAGAGKDKVYGNEGNDHIDGGSQDDKIWGGIGNDKINGSAGNDIVWGEEGNDNIDGGAGDDEIHGGIGNDNIEGSSGNDNLYGDEGNDHIRGDSGNDLLNGGLDIDNLNGNAGADTCVNGETLSSCEL